VIVHSEAVATGAERELLNVYTNILYQRASHDAFGENGTHTEHCADRSHQDQVSHWTAASALATLGSSLGGLQFGIDSQGDLIHENRNQHNCGAEMRVWVCLVHAHAYTRGCFIRAPRLCHHPMKIIPFAAYCRSGNGP